MQMEIKTIIRMKITLIFLTLFLSLSGNSQDKETKCSVKNELVEFVNQHFQELSDNGYFVVSDVLSNKDIERMTNGWNDILKPKNFTMMRKLSIKNKADQIDFTKFFSDEDFEYMKCQLKENTIENWKHVMPKGFFHKADSVHKVIKKHNSLKKIRDSENTNEILKARGKLIHYSIPLFDKDHTHILVYREKRFSGVLFVFKKQDNEWTGFARLLIWIE